MKRQRVTGLHAINDDTGDASAMSAPHPTLHELRTKLEEAHEQLAVTLSAQKGYEEIFLTTSANSSDILQLLSKNFRVDYVSPSCLAYHGIYPGRNRRAQLP